ncbi:MAG: hypothetical protein WAQ98_33715 [Blastocatellia bacterium]
MNEINLKDTNNLTNQTSDINKADGQSIKSINSVKSIKTKLKSFCQKNYQQLKQQLLVIAALAQEQLNALKLNPNLKFSSSLRIGLLLVMLVILPGLELCAYAQQGGATGSTGSTGGGTTGNGTATGGGASASVESVAINAFNTIYNRWRLPVCALLFFLAVLLYFQGDQGKVQAVGVVIGIVIWALVPYFRDIVFGWFGDKAATSATTT